MSKRALVWVAACLGMAACSTGLNLNVLTIAPVSGPFPPVAPKPTPGRGPHRELGAAAPSAYWEQWKPLLAAYRRGQTAWVSKCVGDLSSNADKDDRPLYGLELAMSLLGEGRFRAARDTLCVAIPEMQKMAMDRSTTEDLGDLFKHLYAGVKQALVTEFGPYSGEPYERLFGSALFALTTLADPEQPPSLDEAYVRNYQKLIEDFGADWELTRAEMRVLAKDDAELKGRIEQLNFTLGLFLSAIFDEDWNNNRETARQRYGTVLRLASPALKPAIAAHLHRVASKQPDPTGTSPVWVVVLTAPELRKRGVYGPVPDLLVECAKSVGLPGLGDVFEFLTRGKSNQQPAMPQPRLETCGSRVATVRVGSAGESATLESVCDLKSFAQEAFQVAETGRRLRLAVRAQAKGGISQLEKADDRCWTLMPGDVRVARLCLPHGSRKLEIGSGRGASQTQIAIDVAPQGRPTMVLVTMCDHDRFGTPVTNRPVVASEAAASRPQSR